MSKLGRQKAEDRRPVRRKGVLRMEERGRQVTRLLDLLRALENARHGLSVQDIIEQLDGGCSQRTVYRDLQHLQAAGFPIVGEEGRYRVDGTTLASDALRPSQVLALLLAFDSSSLLSGFGLERELIALGDSLRARLTPEGRDWIDLMRSLVKGRTTAVEMRMDAASFDAIEDALFNEEVLEIEYGKAGEALRTRAVEPHLLLAQGGRTYLVAFCRDADDFRHFALQRIKRARLLGSTFERQNGFDRDVYVGQNFGAYRGPAHDIALRFSPEVAHLPMERQFHSTQEVERQEDESVVLKMTVGGLPEIAAWIAGFGGRVEVRRPPELRELVHEIHQKGLAASHPPRDATGRDADAPLPSSGVELRDTARETPDSRKSREPFGR